jgi:hypothetical protein
LIILSFIPTKLLRAFFNITDNLVLLENEGQHTLQKFNAPVFKGVTLGGGNIFTKKIHGKELRVKPRFFFGL